MWIHQYPGWLGVLHIASDQNDLCQAQMATTAYIGPGLPRDLLNIAIEALRIEYNTYRPQSSRSGLTPAEWAEQWTGTHPALPMTAGPLDRFSSTSVGNRSKELCPCPSPR